MHVAIDLIETDSDPPPRDLSAKPYVFGKPTMIWSETVSFKKCEELVLRPGLSLFIERKNDPEHQYGFEIIEAPMEFGVLLFGQSTCTLKNEDGLQKKFMLLPGTAFVTYSPETYGIQEHAVNPLLSVGLMIDPKILFGYDIGSLDMYPKHFLDIVNGFSKTPFFNFSSTSKRFTNIALQIVNCQYEGLARTLFLESKALEFLAEILNQLSDFKKDPLHKSPISSNEIEKINAAKEIIEQQFKYPPSLLDLAKQVGLTHTRLNRGFRELYGNSVFGYLRAFRMEHARLLLLSTQLTVSEVAYTSGFNDVSYFSKCFHRTFGVQPGKYRKGAFA